MNNTNKNLSEILLRKKKQLISRFLSNKETGFMDRYARILDDYFRNNFERSIIGPGIGSRINPMINSGINSGIKSKINSGKHPFAVIALGGYGRGEQCIHSDVDLLFLFKKSVPDEAKNLIREMVYPLWDIGFDVSPATRSMEECINLSGENFEILTPLLDARFICGTSLLYSELMEQLYEKIISRHSDFIIQWLVERNRKRHQHFGDSAYLLEPNLKEGHGGLRDYHTLLWIARIKSNIKEPRDLEYYGYLSHDEFICLTEALSFIWNVRNRLHQIAGRKCDQLYLEYQIKLANALNFKKINGREPVERFLGELHGRMEFLKQLHLMFFHELRHEKKITIGIKPVKQTRVKGLEIKRGMIYFISSVYLLKSPDLLIKIFKESSRLKLPLSIEAKRLIKEFGYLIDDNFRSSDSIIRDFERILAGLTPSFNVLNEMFITGFLVRFIPEMEGIVNRIQYNEYHLYPVDIHLLHTVQTINEFGNSENPASGQLYKSLYKELKNRKLLLWTALLHDIGKAESDEGHSERGAKIVRNILKKKGLKEKDIETVSFLIKEHLLLIKTATRRDINDEEPALFCARKIKNTERMKMLYLLTVADSISTGPKAWNEWTSVLLRDLFIKILSILETGELATNMAVKTVERKKKKVLSIVNTPQLRQDFTALFNIMSPRYLLYTRAHDIVKHVRLYNRLENGEFIWEVKKTADSNTRTVIIFTKDKPGLFSKIAGIFTLNNIHVLDARVYTWRNNIALDILKVKPPPDKLFEKAIWARTEKNLKYAINGKLNLDAALRKRIAAYPTVKPQVSAVPDKIVVDNNSSSFFTIIEVFTYDFPGLLFKITSALFRYGLDIRVAKIATKVDQMVDVFYVRDFDGQKIDTPDQVLAVKTAIAEVLPSL